MRTHVSAAHRETQQRIAQQVALVKELEQAGLKTLAGVTRNILTAMQKSEELMEPYYYRRTKKRRSGVH